MLRTFAATMVAWTLVRCTPPASNDGEALERTSTATTASAPRDVPDWVSTPPADDDGDGATARTVYFGVGTTRGVRNRALARASADNRARAAVAKALARTSSTSGTKVDASVLNGVQIVERWVDPSDGAAHSLARLELEPHQQAADSVSAPSP